MSAALTTLQALGFCAFMASVYGAVQLLEIMMRGL